MASDVGPDSVEDPAWLSTLPAFHQCASERRDGLVTPADRLVALVMVLDVLFERRRRRALALAVLPCVSVYMDKFPVSRSHLYPMALKETDNEAQSAPLFK